MSASAFETKRIALIGFGVAGRVFHAPLIDATPGLALAAIVTGNRERAAQAESRYPRAEILPNTDHLWLRAREFDAVVVASPNAVHFEQADAAIDAELAVVVDKPMVAASDQAQRLIDAAAERGVALTVFQNRRWDADFLTLRGLIEDGRLGDIRRFESRYERWRPEPRPGWRRDTGAAGGLLFDLGSHIIDQALSLFGPVNTVYAEIEPRYADSQVDDDSFVALTHTSGVRSHLWASSVAPDLGPRFRVLGSDAAYVKFGIDPQEARLREGDVPGDEGWGEESESAWGECRAGDHIEPVASQPGDYPAFYAQFAAALAGEAPVPVDPTDALAGLAIIEAARTSAATRQLVKL